MEAKDFVDVLADKLGIDAFYGVPDSLLRSLCDELLERCLSVLDADNEGVCIDDDELDLIAAAGDINARLKM